MRIGLDMRMSGGDYGIGRYSFELVKNILQIDHDNEYILFVRDLDFFKRAGFEEYSNVTLVKADYRHYSFAEQTKFLWLLWHQKLDFVHFMNFNLPVFYNRPYVVTLHDVIHYKMPGNKPTRFLHRFAGKWVIRHAAQAAQKIITVSNFSKKEIVETLDVPAEKITVIYEASRPISINESDMLAVQQKYHVSKDYIIFVGVMERKKNLLRLAEAFDQLKENYSLNIQLVMVGKMDKYYPEIADKLRSIKYAKDLIFTDSISDKEKYALLKGAKSFVSASLFEGFGLPGLEAMSIGVPLIVSNTEVFNEVYDNGAIYFDPYDPKDIAQKINMLLTDDKYRSLIANNAFVRAGNFSWQKCAAETLKVYASFK